MDLPYDKLIKLIWLAFALCWLWYARRAKAVQRRESPGLRFAKYWLPLIAAGALLGPGDWYGSGDAGLKWQWLPESDAVRLLGCVLALAGVAFAVRARQVLGENWSVAVQLKQDHELVERGPYRWVRHPLYLGWALAVFGAAHMTGSRLLFAAISTAYLVLAVPFEERSLLRAFGDAYAQYQRAVPWRILPFVY